MDNITAIKNLKTLSINEFKNDSLLFESIKHILKSKPNEDLVFEVLKNSEGITLNSYVFNVFRLTNENIAVTVFFIFLLITAFTVLIVILRKL